MKFSFTHEVTKLYASGLSLNDISQQLGCSVHKVAYWLNKAKVTKRTPSQALYLKYNPNGDPFSIKDIKTTDDAFLYGLGIGIYWGEGNKADPYAAKVANTDPQIILSFIKFLTRVCGVKPEKIKYSLVCFNDHDPRKIATYWSKVLGVPNEKFGKIVRIPPQGKGTYRRKSEFGVCTVGIYNRNFKRWLLHTLATIDCPDSSAVEHVIGNDEARVRLSVWAHSTFFPD